MTNATHPGRDAIFRDARPIAGFSFNAETASVVEAMLERSVPFYGGIQRMLGEENDEMLRRAGFRSVGVFLKGYNFCGLNALK